MHYHPAYSKVQTGPSESLAEAALVSSDRLKLLLCSSSSLLFQISLDFYLSPTALVPFYHRYVGKLFGQFISILHVNYDGIAIEVSHIGTTPK